MPKVIKEDIAKVVQDVLEFRQPQRTNFRTSTAYKAVSKILDTIAEALRRGEDVAINGFGIFRIVTKPATRSSVQYFYGPRRGTYREIIDIPAKKYVKFIPSKVLRRMLDES